MWGGPGDSPDCQDTFSGTSKSNQAAHPDPWTQLMTRVPLHTEKDEDTRWSDRKRIFLHCLLDGIFFFRLSLTMPLAVFPSVSPQPGKRAEVTQRPKLPKSSSYRREAGRDGGAEDPAQKEKASPVAPEHRGIIFSTFTSGCRVYKTKALPSGISSLSPLQPGLHEIKVSLMCWSVHSGPVPTWQGGELGP